MKRYILIGAFALASFGCAGSSAHQRLVDIARHARDVGCNVTRVGCRVADRVCAATGGPDVLGDDDIERIVSEEEASAGGEQ